MSTVEGLCVSFARYIDRVHVWRRLQVGVGVWVWGADCGVGIRCYFDCEGWDVCVCRFGTWVCEGVCFMRRSKVHTYITFMALHHNWVMSGY